MSKKMLLAVIPMLAVLNLLAVPAAYATGVSQIVLSCTTPPPESQSTNGCSSSELVTTPPIIVNTTLFFVGGFWVWCQSPIGAGTPYGPDCAGSVYVEEVNLISGAGVYEATSVSGSASAKGPTGLQVTFTSSDGDMTCTLNVPTSPTRGGTSTLKGTCNGVPITFTNAVVNVT